jgi:hypothetical protein
MYNLAYKIFDLDAVPLYITAFFVLLLSLAGISSFIEPSSNSGWSEIDAPMDGLQCYKYRYRSDSIVCVPD